MKTKISVLLLLLFIGISAMGQVPPKPDPPRLVNDFAGIFTPEQVKSLEDTLVAFSKRTSNQIVVVTLPDLGGLDRAQMATKIGQEWGVGKADHDNGVVLLIKPKTPDSNGEVFIAPGIGLEGAIPDGACSSIIRKNVIPHFRENDYFGGVWDALTVIMPLAAGEYSYEEEEEDDDGDDAIGLIIALIIIIALIVLAARDKNHGSSGFGGRGPIVFGSGSAFSGGSSSWSSSRSSGGGFGGFGGGSFSGGGAGGSW